MLAMTPPRSIVGHQHHRQIGRFGEAHIGDVGGPQIDFGGAARPFHQHQIDALGDFGETFQHLGHQAGFQLVVIARPGIGQHLALDHHLRAHIRLRLQQHRVHVTAGRHPTRPGLQRLSPANFTAICGDGGVVGHVLGLERAHLQATSHQGAGDAGHQQRLAHIGPGALKHQSPKGGFICQADAPSAAWPADCPTDGR